MRHCDASNLDLSGVNFTAAFHSSSLSSSGESDESDWTMEYDFPENIVKRYVCNT